MSSAADLLYNWLHGTADGGPNGDGRYPLIGADGETYLIKCPAAQALDPSMDPTELEVFANTALQAANEASDSADSASTSASNASASATAADTSRSQALSYRNTASTHATTATDKASEAASSASAAAGSASTASTANTNAQSAKTAAETASTKAQDWADKNEDSPVETGKFSARHWALKAAASAAALASLAWDMVQNKPATATRWPTWSEVTSKPSTFAPSSHTHTIANVTGLQAGLDAKYNSPSGTTSQYIRGNGSLATFPSIPAGTVTSVAGGNGLTGTVTSSGSITLGTPGTLTGSTTNAVQTSSHTHALSTNLKAWDGVNTQNPLLGSTSDATSATKTLTLASNGYAGIIAAGDYSNTSGEPGGSFFAAAIDGPAHTGSTTTILSAINTAGEDGTGGTWTGTTSNSGLLAVRGNFRLQLGSNGEVAMYVQGANATFNGNASVAGSLTVGGTNVALESRSISAGNGMSGGGTLAANRTITLGTPGTITGSTTNAVQSSSHTHALTLAAGDIPNLPASKVTSGSFNAARIPNLNASKITAGTLPIARGGTGGTSKATARTGIGIFVQSGDPGSSAATGDLWIW